MMDMDTDEIDHCDMDHSEMGHDKAIHCPKEMPDQGQENSMDDSGHNHGEM